MIVRGSVAVVIDKHKIDRIPQQGFFGEIGLIANVPRTASVHTLEPCVLLSLHSDAFWEILVQNLDMALFVENTSEIRIKQDLAVLGSLSKKAG